MFLFRAIQFRKMTVLGAALLLAACANLAGPRDVSIPLSKLQAGIEKRFPLDNRAMELFEIHLTNPRLSLQPGADRVNLALDVAVAPPFLKQSWRGSMALSGRLSIDPARGAVFINDPHLDAMQIDGIDSARQQQFGMLANAIISKSIRDVAVYNFRTEDLRYAGVQFIPTAIRTSADAVIIHVEPAK